MFFFIIWGIVSNVILKNIFDYRLYFISLTAAFLLQYLMNKLEKKWPPKIIAALIGILLTLVVSKGIYFLFNSIFIVFILFMTDSMEYEDINYDAYKARAKNGLILILFLGALLPLVDINLSKSILKFYIMFLVSNVLVMREARSYYYKIRNKRSFTANILISLSILVLAIDKIFAGFLAVVNFIINIFNIIVSYIIDFLGMILSKPLTFCIEKLREIMIRGAKLLEGNEANIDVKETPIEKIPWDDSAGFHLPVWAHSLVRMVAVIIVLVIAYLIISKFINLYGNRDKGIEEERESIRKLKTKKDGFIKKIIKNIFKPGDLRNQILNVYKKFEEKTFEKGIFKRHMTAKQLGNITKAYVDNPEGLDSLTNIYNEAKFSKHNVSEVSLKAIKEEFNKVKKQL
jgi:hypothetical protein